MKSWILFALFVFVGVGMMYMGLANMYREKDAPQSRKVYGFTALVGLAVAVGSVMAKFVL